MDFTIVFAGVFAANIGTLICFWGYKTMLSAKNDNDVPIWAMAAFGFPMLLGTVSVYLVT